jgi:L-amino acid N-acyltransferase YncA
VTAIVPMTAAHWPAVEAIYARGIGEGNATFEARPPDWERFSSSRLMDHSAVALDDIDTVVGWVAITPVSSRPVYAGVVEHSVYVHPDAAGRGIGRALVERLIESTERAGIWTIQSSIFPENEASMRLHAAAGFREVGRRERIALMSYGPYAGTWRDTILVERRSDRAGA